MLFRGTTVHLLSLALLVSAPNPSRAQTESEIKARYTKFEFRVPMRDGARLFTAVYVPKDQSRTYPLLLVRTPYSVGPYGVDAYPSRLGPSEHFSKEGFIFVYQDARGRYMSEGEFQQVRPHRANKHGPKDVDESTDTYDTIEWLLKNVPNHNGRVGMVGISQPGFHVAASMIDTHPALKAASPQAPTADYYLGDDVYHNGAFMLAANFGFYSAFIPRTTSPKEPEQSLSFAPPTPDGYDFFLHCGPLATINKRLLKGEASYWQEIVDHTTYDEFWKQRSVWKYMDTVKCAVLNVGGWFDAEDPMGPLRIFRSLESANARSTNSLVMGPWQHGGWGWSPGNKLGNVDFASKTGEYFREHIQFPFFMRYLKDAPADIPKAHVFLTGINEWRKHADWPPKAAIPSKFYFRSGGRLSANPPTESGGLAFDQYESDPNRPVPYVGYTVQYMVSEYVTEDQRFAARRPDVLVYETEPLEQDVVGVGPVDIDLRVSSSGTDSDFIVKLIDVYPDKYPQSEAEINARPDSAKMGGYQQLVRGEPFRAKYRAGFDHPQPLVPNQPVQIKFSLPDIYHAFRRGHRIMVQIQSSWFPLVDRNPQKYIEIPRAEEMDFQKATQRVYRTQTLPSSISFLREPTIGSK